MISDYHGRFGAFASLPLPDVPGALRELEYALDTLQLDSVILLSNVDGHYAGDTQHNELLAELNRRKSVVFIHPNETPELIEKTHGAFAPFLEYPIDTGRAFARMMYNGALERYPDIRFILAHAGGNVPFLAERIGKLHYMRGKKIRFGKIIGDLIKKRSSGLDIAKSMYYDIAASTNRYTLRSLQELASPSHILFGTNSGWTPVSATAALIEDLQEYDGFEPADLAAVERRSALELFPRFE